MKRIQNSQTVKTIWYNTYTFTTTSRSNAVIGIRMSPNQNTGDENTIL